MSKIPSKISSKIGFKTPGYLGSTFCVLILTLSVSADLLAGPKPQTEKLKSAPAKAPQAKAVKQRRLTVFPPKIELNSAADFQGLLVQVWEANGCSRDVTEQAKVSVDGAGLRWNESRLAVEPLSDSRGQLTVEYQGLKQRLSYEVSNAKSPRLISFRLDVIPVLTRSGCNTGACHGASRGKDSFRLSLFGYDPEGDHHRLTREFSGRRINLAVPEQSLLIEKALGAVRHSGGRRFDSDSEAYKVLIKWLRGGAKNDPKNVASLTSIELFPKSMVLAGAGQTQKLLVRAHYSDGHSRDVTARSVFLTSNDHSAKVNEAGAVIAGARGEAFVMARYGSHTVGSQVIVRPRDASFKGFKEDEKHYIDALVNAKLRKLQIVPSKLCSDKDYIRRVTLDTIGQLPTIDELNKFLSDKRPDKRARLVDRLLKRPEFVDLWVLKWAELLQIRTTRRVSPKAMLGYFQWLKDRFSKNVPVDKLVLEILSAQGGTFANPPSNYYEIERNTLKLSENAAQVFLGMRIQCAQCHNHPFDRWTQDDYYGFAAFFAQIRRKRGADPRETIVFNRGRGEVKHPVSRRNMAPKFLGGATPNVKGKDRRVVLAEWIVSKDNPYFSKNVANIIWSQFFGIGIIDPVDDVRVSNPASNPQLLEELGTKLQAYQYDFKKLIRDICTSRAYQRSSQATPENDFDNRNFARARLRRIKAEVLLDCISQVTETREKFRGLPLGARAVEIADGRYNNHFLRIFGRPKRDTVCSCEVKMEPTLSQSLHLVNGRTVSANIRKGQLARRRMLKGKTPLAIVDEIYLRSLCRKPNKRERQAFEALLKNPKGRRQALDDIFWAVLNSREFIFNH